MSETPFKVGVAGLTHGHVWGLIDSFKKEPNTQLVAVAESDDILETALPSFDRSYTDLREMLEKEELDGLIVTSDNKTSAEIAIAALEKGIPCLVEKAMARNAKEADAMLAASAKTGATLMINWPLAWSPWLHDLKARLETDPIGHVFFTKFRNGHFGPKEIGCGPEFYGWLFDEELNGGGAIADFCSYGAVLCRWYYGMPEKVFAVRGVYTKDYPVPDDHAVCILEYPKGNAMIEGTWSTKGFDPSGNPVIHGSEGTLSVFGNTVHLNKGREEETFEPAALPISSPAQYFMECVAGKRKPEGILDPVIAADACRILDAAVKSSASGKAEPV